MAVTGRPREFDRAAALEAAMHLFWQKGFLATSMNDLCEAMGIRSPSLYAAFKSKEALYLEAFDHYARSRGDTVWAALSQDGRARDAIVRLLQLNADAVLASGDKPAGCMVSLGGVGDTWPEAVAHVAPQLRRDCLDALKTRLSTAVAEGELPASTDVDRLGRFYIGMMQAMAVQAKDGATRSDLMGLIDTAMTAWPAG